MKLEGNLINRLMEGQNASEITEGMDITMYYYSDRKCYFVTKVYNQKRIEVRRYEVCADHEKEGGMGHQNWKYFKTKKEACEYLDRFFPGTIYNGYENPSETWVYRYNKWMRERTLKDENGKESKNYYNLDGKLSFGRRDYYHDWEF